MASASSSIAATATDTLWPTPSTATQPVSYEELYLIEQALIPFAVRNLCIQIAFSSAIVTLYAFLVLLSQPHHRRTWTFALVSLVATLFFVTAFTNSAQLTHSLLHPTTKVPLGIEFCDAFITLCLPWFADWVIFLRAVALVPVRDRRKPKYMALGILILLIKVIRGGFLIYLNIHLHIQMRDSMSPADLGTKVWPVAPSTWVEYGGMLLDTTICAAVCTWRLTTLMTPSRSESRSKALQERLRLLLFNTISSFIFPAISALVMIILAASSSFDTYSSAPKINSGIVAMNVLIAMLIPIIDASVTENRQTAQRDAALTDSFLRQHKSRSMSLTTSPQLGIVSGNGGGGARPSSRAGVLPTTMVERLEQLQQQQQQQQRQQQQQQRYVGDMMRSGSGSGSDADKEVLELQQRRRRVPSGASGSGAANGRALADVSDTHSPRPGTATSLGWPASDSYEPSMVEKTPVLDYSLESAHRKDDDELELGDGDDETGLTHWNSARRSSNSLGSIRRERARDGIEGEREVVSAVPPLPVPAPTLFSAETNPGRPVATTTFTTTTAPMSPSARRRASPGPAPGSGGTGLSLSDSERSLGSDQLATTDEHRIRLRSMPRRKRP